MSYTGAVTTGGHADVRRLVELTIKKLSVGPMDNNAYLLTCNATGDQLLIDAANEPHRLLDLIGPGGLNTIVTTHRHHDHWAALEDTVKATGAHSVAHSADVEGIPGAPDSLRDGDTVRVGDCELSVIHLVGHTPGSIALYYRDPAPDGIGHLFTGDSLFPGGCGRTESPEDFASLINDVESKLFALPDDTWFYPGHGGDSTLGEQRPHLAEWRERGW